MNTHMFLMNINSIWQRFSTSLLFFVSMNSGELQRTKHTYNFIFSYKKRRNITKEKRNRMPWSILLIVLFLIPDSSHSTVLVHKTIINTTSSINHMIPTRQPLKWFMNNNHTTSSLPRCLCWGCVLYPFYASRWLCAGCSQIRLCKSTLDLSH